MRKVIKTALAIILTPAISLAMTMKDPKNPDGKGRFAQCMKKEDYKTCRTWSLKKMQEYSRALHYVNNHNKSVKSVNSGKRKPLRVDQLSKDFEKWYTRYLVLGTRPFYKD